MTAIAKLLSIKILVAHDHPALRSHIRTCLEAFGYEVTEIESCKQATNAMNTSKFSAMVFNGDAPDFLSEAPLIIRSTTINRDTPCIILAQSNSLISTKKTSTRRRMITYLSLLKLRILQSASPP
jgi:DNA-binding NtrC family response regulator